MAISKKNGRKAKKQTDVSHTVFETAPKAALLMLFTGLFILFISTFFTLNLPSPVALSRPIALTALLAGSAIGGLFCARRIESPGAFASAALAVLVLVILLIVAKELIPSTVSNSSATFSIVGYIACALSAISGALLGSKNKKRKRRKKPFRS